MIIGKGDKVKHKARDQWGVGQVIKVERGGTVVVNFEGGPEQSIAQGAKFLVKVDEQGNTIKKPEKIIEGERTINKEYPDWGVGEVLENSIDERVKKGLKNIEDPFLRRDWCKLTYQAHIELAKAGFERIQFSEFEKKGTFGKAQTGIVATKWAFAKIASSTWVELELRPRGPAGSKYAQSDFYQFIKSSYQTSDHKNNNITWDEEDRRLGLRKPGSLPIRIKIVLDPLIELKLRNEKWIEIMLQLIQIFDPIIQSYRL
jgi:hypothetical protein